MNNPRTSRPISKALKNFLIDREQFTSFTRINTRISRSEPIYLGDIKSFPQKV